MIISAVRISAQASLSQAQAGQAVQIEGNSISFYMSLSDLPRMAMPKQKSRAASRGNELTRSMELHDAEFSPCPLPLMNESDRTKARYLSI